MPRYGAPVPDSSPVDHGRTDRHGRAVTLREIGDDWRAVADVAPLDDQRPFVAALAARYLLLSDRGGLWHSLAVYAGDEVAGHVMWAVDDDGSHWIGGVMVDGSRQGAGIGRAAMETMIAWLGAEPACDVVRLSYSPQNVPAARLYTSLGFTPTGERDGEEIVVELDVVQPPANG